MPDGGVAAEAEDEVAPQRPSVSEVHEVLRAHGAFLVHFSSYPPMRSLDCEGLAYPTDLIAVGNRKCVGGICCSTILPRDNFAGGGNASGYIGLLLRPVSDRSIIAASHEDIGSYVVNGVRQYLRPLVPVLRSDLENSITQRAENAWNEWIVDDYEPVGVITVGPGAAYGAGEQTPEQLRETFGFPVYRFEDGRFFRLHGDRWLEADHGELYP